MEETHSESQTQQEPVSTGSALPVSSAPSQTSSTATAPITVKPRKSIFVDDTRLITIHLSDDNWAKVPERFSYAFAEEHQGNIDKNSKEAGINLLAKCITEWSLVLEDGVTIAPINKEYIRKLDVIDSAKIISVVQEKLGLLGQVPKVDTPPSSAL